MDLMGSVGYSAGIQRAGSMTKKGMTKAKAGMTKAKAEAKTKMESEAKLERDRRLKDEVNQHEGSRSKCIRRNSKGTAKFLIRI